MFDIIQIQQNLNNTKMSIQEYRHQRQERQKRRQIFLDRLRNLKLQMPQQSSPIQQNIQHNIIQNSRQHKNKNSSDIEQLTQQNVDLKMELNKYLNQWQESQNKEQEKLQLFKRQIQKVKKLYSSKIGEISSDAKTRKQNDLQQMKKLKEQIQNAQNKNNQIENDNSKFQQQAKHFNELMGKYTTQIRNQYAQKMNDFTKIYEESNEKLKQMEENEDNNQQLINSVLNDEEMIKNLKTNSQTGNEQMDQMVRDYQQLLDAKNEVYLEIKNNIAMKETELARMNEIQGKMKSIMNNLQEEKQIYIGQNKNMHAELMEVKDLLTKTIGQANNE